MAIEVVKKEDLQQFKVQLLNDIKQLLKSPVAQPVKPWLKNSEVRKLLDISSNTIRRLGLSRELRHSKIGGIYYYWYEDIEKLLKSNSV
ncbi:helix-turn-helix domain-containing protein [Ginsengibacter hankyongi]|uniref:Helix-turn-helix domain-containing protein n=1 Tax=Ginsengibacter hankyongi TaxID=2607284 RepID=A0A5J5IIF6_9BACT|nr:helix-turn-helix domain-containing protein [Ginsengibacter hankyongi]KAA9040561.1 helix-turn-helix domain-containing protein [Ginsengibacter hankyongi]